jgi:hypothetical protein
MQNLIRLLMPIFAWLGLVTVAQAGMPMPELTDVARLRLETISFFLMVFLLCAWGVKGLWNSLAKDFTSLPTLSYRRALALTTLWGLMFVIVLTMISGARELMTPGAWEKNGSTYKLRQPTYMPAIALVPREVREEQLKKLWAELLKYASQNGGSLPSARDAEAIDAARWHLPDYPTIRFEYLPDRTTEKTSLIAFEPAFFADGQLGLLSDGQVRFITRSEAIGATQP